MKDPDPGLQDPLFLKCECTCHILELQRFEYEEKEQGFYVAMWTPQDWSSRMGWRERLRWCWHLLTKGRLLADNIILTNEQARSMAEYVGKYLPKS